MQDITKPSGLWIGIILACILLALIVMATPSVIANSDSHTDTHYGYSLMK